MKNTSSRLLRAILDTLAVMAVAGCSPGDGERDGSPADSQASDPDVPDPDVPDPDGTDESPPDTSDPDSPPSDVDAGCLIEGTFWPEGTVNPENACQSCVSSENPAGWSDLPSGTSCGTAEVCVAASCLTYDYRVLDNVVQAANGSTAQTLDDCTAALGWAAGQANARVYMPAGTCDLRSSLYLAEGVHLFGDGDGPSGTVFTVSTSTRCSGATVERPYCRIAAADVDNVTMEHFRFTGYLSLELWAQSGETHGGHIIRDVTGYETVGQPFVFGTWTSQRGTLDGIQVIRCKAIDTSSIGFALEGDKANSETCKAEGGWTRNVTFEDCEAAACGQPSRFNTYVVGFDLAEGTNIENIHLLRCTADSNWMNGYHFEMWPYVMNVDIVDSTANDNGVVRNNPSGGYGYLFNLSVDDQDVVLTNCTGSGNFLGDTPDGDLPPPG